MTGLVAAIVTGALTLSGVGANHRLRNSDLTGNRIRACSKIPWDGKSDLREITESDWCKLTCVMATLEELDEPTYDLCDKWCAKHPDNFGELIRKNSVKSRENVAAVLQQQRDKLQRMLKATIGCDKWCAKHPDYLRVLIRKLGVKSKEEVAAVLQQNCDELNRMLKATIGR